MKHILNPFLILFMLLGGCATAPTPEAVVYDTLQAAALIIDTKQQLFETEVAAGKVSAEEIAEVRKAYRAANLEILNTAKAARNGFESPSTETVNLLVAAFIKVVTKVIPPPERN